jgi:CDP-diacylglycerol--glycerol-3-phosphate 3-phosphatidyltransferase
MLDRRLRTGVERTLGPLGRALGRIGVTPDALTIAGVIFAIGTAIAVATGHLILGAVGIGLSGLGDLLDGNLARSSGRTGPRGAFFDSVTDRVSDAVVLGGFAWYLAGTSTPQLAVLPFAVAALSMLISYERAKAEGLGYEARGGIMERAERSIFLALALVIPHAMVPVLWLMAVLSAYTAVQRFVRVWRQADRPPRPEHATREPRVRRTPRRPVDRTAVAAGPRLREWWEARASRSERRRRRHPAARRTRP